ncbi:MAG TPA: amino acid permease C-terminal domain-containing protein, partial [Halobacteriales archaeon]|nr:amino acid permease C-terminal domain-containing protein [Halobacteriales archaeon]
IHHRYGTPFVAVVASAAVMLIAVVVVPIRTVGNLASLFTLLGFIIVNASVIKLRRERPAMQRPYELPFYPYPPILGIGLNLLLGLFIDPVTWALAIGWLGVGVVAYVAWGRVRARREGAGPAGVPDGGTDQAPGDGAGESADCAHPDREDGGEDAATGNQGRND